jgi:hypothetical protein
VPRCDDESALTLDAQIRLTQSTTI